MGTRVKRGITKRWYSYDKFSTFVLISLPFRRIFAGSKTDEYNPV